jgi:hypothetical protein
MLIRKKVLSALEECCSVSLMMDDYAEMSRSSRSVMAISMAIALAFLLRRENCGEGDSIEASFKHLGPFENSYQVFSDLESVVGASILASSRGIFLAQKCKGRLDVSMVKVFSDETSLFFF